MGDTEPFSFKPYKVIKQTVILDFDYENELILGFTEIYVDIINDTLDQLSLHCHPCTIHQVSLNDKFTSNYIIPVDGDFSTFLRDSDETFQGLAKVQMDEVREKTSWIPAIVSAVEQQKFSKAMLLLKENVIQYFIEKGNLKINLPLIEPSKNKIKLGIHFSLDCSDSILSPVHFAKKIINNSNSLELNYVNGATLEAQVVFPCFNHYSDRCSDWEFNFIVSSSLISSNRYNEGSFKFLPVCTGNLVQTQIYEKENSVRYIVKSQSAMSASHFGFVLGTFDIMDIQEPQFSSLDTLGDTSDEDFKPPGNVLVYCLPGKREAALYTIDPILCILKYYEWLLHTDLPSKTLSIVFAEGFENPILNNFGLIFLSQHLLLSPKIIDATYSTRRLLAYAVAYQYTFYKALPKDLADSWLLQGLTSYISDEFLGKYHGQAEMLFKKKRDMDTVISLDVDQPPLYYNEWESIGQSCTEFAKLKSGLVYHMISSKIGRGSFFKILNILYSYCSNTGTNNGVGGDTVCSVETNVVIIVSTLDFLKLIRKVTGKDLKEFAMQWIYQPGVPHLQVSFHFNPKKAAIQLKIRQSCDHSDRHTPLGSPSEAGKFVGPLKIRIVERDGPYDHSVHIEEQVHTFEIPYHAKHKRPKAKSKGGDPEEQQQQNDLIHKSLDDADIGLDQSESPVCWIRIDPDYEWLRSIEHSQPDYMWMEQLYKDKDVLAQAEALISLCKHPSHSSLTAFDRVIADWKIYYQIRCMAVTSLASIAMTCPPLKEEAIAHLISIFETKFCLPRGRPNDPLVVKPNHFDNFPNYFLQKWIPQVLSHIKTDGGKCPIEIQRFLLHLLRYNDNTMNPFSDSFYIATLIQSLTESLIPSTVDPRCKPDTILLKDAIAEIERYRFLDLVEPSYHNQVTISILQASIKLQHSGLLLVDLNLFWQYWKPQNYLFVRQTAIEALLLLSPPSIAPSQMSEAEMLSHVLKWLLFIRNIYCTDQESIQCTSSNNNQDTEGCLGSDWLHAETVNNFVGRPLMIKLIIDSLKKSIMVSTKISQVFVKDETCKYLLKMLFKKVLASGRLELIEPILLICRIGLPAAPVPEIDH